MQSYKRKITYFYQYHNGTVGSTAGFLKLEIRGEKVKIIINIQEPMGLPQQEAALYFYHEAGDHLAAIQVDRIESMNGVLTYQAKTDWQKVFHTDRDLYTFDGMAVVYNDSHYYIGDFADKDRRDYELVKRESKMTKTVPVMEEKSEEKSLKEETRSETWKTEVILKKELEKEKNPEIRPMESGKTSEPRQEEPGKASGTRQMESEKTSEPRQEEPGKASESKQTEAEKDTETKQPETEILPEVKKLSSEIISEEYTEKENALGERVDIKALAENDAAFGNCEQCPYQEKRREQHEDVDAFEKMVQDYPKLPMYGATELFDCVRIHPRDIGKLDMRNWRLGVNSFLTHGFYTYQYLLLGKLRFEDGSYRGIIGVPGVYSNREKYLANMFGFDQFIPVKKTGIKTGEFGYWIVEIIPSL